MEINLSRWMENLIGSKPVLQYNIPGTHDSVTQYVQYPHITKCQNTNIYNQLCMGIRLLDIRTESKNERLKMVHAFAKAFNTPNRLGKQMDMEDVLNHCYRFLLENPSETVIFMFKNDSKGSDEACLSNLYNTYIKDDAEKWFIENRIPALDEVRGKILLLNRCKSEISKKIGINCSCWEDQGENNPKPLPLETGGHFSETFIIQDRYGYKREEKWNAAVKPFLDSSEAFSGKYIINYLSTAGGIKGPYRNSKYINPQFMQYPLKKGVYYGVICCDFPTAELTAKIIETNFIESK